MAFVVLTSSQKEELLGNAEFQKQVKWAILDKADYWGSHDGVTPPGGVERWRKAKGFAKIVLDTASLAEGQDNVKKFLIFIKNVQCVDNSIVQYVAQNSIDRLLATSGFDSAADKWFDGEIAQTL